MPRFAWLITLISAVGLAACEVSDVPADQVAVGDVEFGRDTAAEWCGGCHVIGVGDAMESDAPPFTMLLELRTPEEIGHYLTWERHPAMPALALEAQDVEDLVAYFSYLDAQ